MAYASTTTKAMYVKSSKPDYTYFGARYYDSDLSVWLSVDPLSDMYPSTSPFMYVLGNPVRYTDPDGRWVKGEGFWRNIFKSDNRINAENRVSALKKQGIDANKSRNWKAGGWDVTYSSNESWPADLDAKGSLLSSSTVENFSKKNRNNEVAEAVSFIDIAMDNGMRSLTKPLGNINTGVGSVPHRVSKAVASIILSIPNAIKTLTMNENIFDEKTDNIDAVFSVIDIVTLGADGIVIQATKMSKPLIPVSKVGVELINANKNVIKAGNATLETTKTLTGK
jgi:RHS repeat-associated protein